MGRQALVSAVLALAVMVPAVAAKPIATKSETVTVGPSQDANPRPKCGGGKTAIAGGYEAEFRIGDPAGPVLAPSTFRRDQDAWFFSIRNRGGGGSFTGYAYCAKQDVSISFEPFVVPGNTPSATNAAKCPQRTVALSGGYVAEFAGTPQLVPFALKRVAKRSWAVSAANLGSGELGLTAYVVCTSRALGDLKVKPVTGEALLAAAGSGSTATATAECPAGRRVVSGGFEAPSYADGVLVHESRRIDKRTWQVTASAQGSAGGSVTAYAYCIPA